MPFKKTSPFRPPAPADTLAKAGFSRFNGHWQTILPSISRKFEHLKPQRERLELPDGDFLDIDFFPSKTGDFDKTVILTHGLEGSSESQYVLGMADFFVQKGWAAVAWNCRSCSGELNRLFRFYHHGDFEDLEAVARHVILAKKAQKIALVGFSMGGSMTLKMAGVLGEKMPREVVAAVGFSVPCDISEGADVLDRWDNFVYKKRFLARLARKIEAKNALFPGRLDVSKLSKVKKWRDFDEWFSAPICGFSTAAEFHEQASSKNFLAGIRVPSLLVTAANDPILTPACWPEKLAAEHPFFHFELTENGGHCGFLERGAATAWSERRAFEFVENGVF